MFDYIKKVVPLKTLDESGTSLNDGMMVMRYENLPGVWEGIPIIAVFTKESTGILEPQVDGPNRIF